jgi:hypothetical protein
MQSVLMIAESLNILNNNTINNEMEKKIDEDDLSQVLL